MRTVQTHATKKEHFHLEFLIKDSSENPFNSGFHVIETLYKRTHREGAKGKLKNAWIND